MTWWHPRRSICRTLGWWGNRKYTGGRSSAARTRKRCQSDPGNTWKNSTQHWLSSDDSTISELSIDLLNRSVQKKINISCLEDCCNVRQSRQHKWHVTNFVLLDLTITRLFFLLIYAAARIDQWRLSFWHTPCNCYNSINWPYHTAAMHSTQGNGGYTAESRSKPKQSNQRSCRTRCGHFCFVQLCVGNR